jgi:hypothetical protein
MSFYALPKTFFQFVHLLFNFILTITLIAMKQKFHYATITEAIEQLRKQGFTLDFNLKENRLQIDDHTYPADEFEIVDLYRYEGATDPADEATVYALASPAGVKGILVSGYGATIDSASVETLKQLHYKYNQEEK